MFAERPTIQWLTGGRLHLQHGPIDVVLKAWGDQRSAHPPPTPHSSSLAADEIHTSLTPHNPIGLPPRHCEPEAKQSTSKCRTCGWIASSASPPRNDDVRGGSGERDCFDHPSDVARAYEAAAARFQTILGELVAELGELRKPVDRGPQVASPVARRMAAACAPFAGLFITPMAAVAGAVADELLAAMLAAAPLARAFVNNGGDIAVHVAPGERLGIGMAANMTRGAVPAMSGSITLTAEAGIGGIATSGRGGRSFSLGIADSVTVLAHNAAAADAAATLIANAVNIDSPAVRRAPAISLDPDSDLGERLVTVDVGRLSDDEIAAALASGESRAAEFRRAGSIAACALTLQGKTLIVGGGLLPSRIHFVHASEH